jgi:hypothetical protein
MRDAAFAANIGTWSGAVAGYIGGPNAYNVWSEGDWKLYPGNRKLPIWVSGLSGPDEGEACLTALKKLGVPTGTPVVADMETRVDRTYLDNFGAVLAAAGYKTWVYGSASTVFANPQLNGYWVADFTDSPFMHSHPGVRATQWASGEDFDSSLIKWWQYYHLWL